MLKTISNNTTQELDQTVSSNKVSAKNTMAIPTYTTVQSRGKKPIVTTEKPIVSPTNRTYSSLDTAYTYFNEKLFNSALPACLLTFQRHKGARGFFVNKRFESMLSAKLTDEIALNPATFEGRTEKEILSTLVHEMTHLWQAHHGTPSRGGYHNAEWARHMETLGLLPYSTNGNGKKTGQSVTHNIEANGLFDIVASEYLETHTIELYKDTNTKQAETTRKKKAASKTKYTCPMCSTNAWAKPETRLICGNCEEEMGAEN